MAAAVLLGAWASACEAERIPVDAPEHPVWIPLSTTDEVALANTHLSAAQPVVIPALARSLDSARASCPERVFTALPETMTKVLSQWMTGETDAGVTTTRADEVHVGEAPFLLYRANFENAGVGESGGYAEQTFAALEPLPEGNGTRLTLLQVAKASGDCAQEPYDPNDPEHQGISESREPCGVSVPEPPTSAFLRQTLPPVDPCGEGLSLRQSQRAASAEAKR